MKTIDSYILERLNPRQLGPLNSLEGSVPGAIEWNFKYNGRPYIINSWGWVYSIEKSSDSMKLIFWTPEMDYVFITDSKTRLFEVAWMKTNVTNKPEFKHTVHSLLSKHSYLIQKIVTPQILEFDDVIGDIVEDFYNKYK